MNVMAPYSTSRQTLMTRPANPGFAAASGDPAGEDLMTRRQVARLFGVTSAAVATWARRGRLPEIRNEADRPRYRRADVEALWQRDRRPGQHDRPAGRRAAG
jgi:hypothetical protein